MYLPRDIQYAIMKGIAICILLLSNSISAQPQTAVGVRLILGLTDTSEVKWDGSATARGARISSLEPWRFEGSDAILEHGSWRASTHQIRLFGGGRLAGPGFVPNGVIVWLDGAGENTELQVKTAQGEFSVSLAGIPYGKLQHLLNGRVMADRIPGVARITDTPEEQDYPAAATDKAGNVRLAYLEFRHNPDHNRLRAPLRQPLSDFADLKSPTGGDQILVRKFSGGVWSEPIPITPPGGDLYRPAIAVDGSGRPWVFWSENQKGNFDLWTGLVENGKAGAPVRLTTEAGSDIEPVAAADAKGNVWVAWQGWRNGRASIFAVSQQGSGFSTPTQISSSTANEWNPAIAADGTGRVTIAWDSYRNGNYDIYTRTLARPGAWGKEMPVAVTARYEAYPSIAYDPSGRFWVAYEEGGELWGKDFGAYDTKGIALYQGRAVRLIGFDRDGRRVTASTDVGTVLPGTPDQRIDASARQSENEAWIQPNPENAKKRAVSRPAQNMQAPRNTLPRLHVDGSGRIWLAFRSAQPIWWNPLGTVWTEHLVSYDGKGWTGPIFLSHSDNLLDNRPALVSTNSNGVVIIGSSDSRRQFHLQEKPAVAPARDPYNNDLYANVLTLPKAAGLAGVKTGTDPQASRPESGDRVEKSAVTALRGYRMKTGIGSLRILRGEFHRHSEISTDGGSDGTLLDQWRYVLDAGALDWVGCCDHDNGSGREYSWWIEQKLTDIFYTPGKFVPMFSYERSVPYPEGHRNVIFAQRGVRTLPRLPLTSPDTAAPAPDTQMLYRYLKTFDGIVASHTSGTNMGTDWRDNDPLVEPVVEIYQGDRQNYEMPGAPRANSESDSIGGWRPKGFVNLALEMGYKLAFQASSDHVSTHMSYCNVLAADSTREAVLDGFKKRHVYGATDNILAEFRSGEQIMGDAFSTNSPPELRVKLAGTAPFAKIHVIRDNKYVYSIEPRKAKVEFTWKDNAPRSGATAYYYVRGEQENGEIVWVSPMWITYAGK